MITLSGFMKDIIFVPELEMKTVSARDTKEVERARELDMVSLSERENERSRAEIEH